MQINRLTLSDYTKMPWKNGKGFTYEIAKAPDQGGFEWRISLAHVDEDGYFSDFSGYERVLSVIEGKGLYLTLDKVHQHTLIPFTDFHFEGKRQVYAQLIDGKIRDFNVIYNAEKIMVNVAWYTITDVETIALSCLDNSTVFLFSANNNVIIDIADECYRLEKRECLTLNECDNTYSVRIQSESEGKPSQICLVEVSSRNDK